MNVNIYDSYTLSNHANQIEFNGNYAFDITLKNVGSVDAGNVSENINLYCQSVGLCTVPRATMDINGITFRFIDTAGFRDTQDEVEQIGIERTIQKIQQARIIIWLLDATPSKSEKE